MRIGKSVLTSWTLIFPCISPWAYKQEGLIHEYKTAIFAMWAYAQGGLIHRVYMGKYGILVP